MRVALGFRLYMMRYGVALLACNYLKGKRSNFSKDITERLASFLTRKVELPDEKVEEFKDYLFSKPGSPRYTPLRKAIEQYKLPKIEYQDLLLSESNLDSSVGALTQDYFNDALILAHILGLAAKDRNVLLARGRLSLSTGWNADSAFRLNGTDRLYLGLWLLDIDCDWIWGLMRQIPDRFEFEITVENRVELLLGSWKEVLEARELRSGRPQNAKIRKRLNELIRITERNVREGLNLGQPWSWFLIPRLELLVDAGILRKRERHGLTGYGLTELGHNFRFVCQDSDGGQVLIDKYFSCHASNSCRVSQEIDWNTVKSRLEDIAPLLRNAVGYYPIFETATALCASKYEDASSDEPIWEIDSIKDLLWKESASSEPKVKLAINRHGQIYAFKAVI